MNLLMKLNLNTKIKFQSIRLVDLSGIFNDVIFGEHWKNLSNEFKIPLSASKTSQLIKSTHWSHSVLENWRWKQIASFNKNCFNQNRSQQNNLIMSPFPLG